MDRLIAKRPNGVYLTVEQGLLTGKYNVLRVVFPPEILEFEREHLENNRSFVICKCPFFSGYLGVGDSTAKAKSRTLETLDNVLQSITDAGSLLSYLRDKGFEITTWGTIAPLSSCRVVFYPKDIAERN